jgi:diaminopimelate decarboxylase
MTQTAQGIKTLLTFAEEVEAHLQEASPRLTVVDIGGGLSANYHSDEARPTHADLAVLLQETCPALFQSHTHTHTTTGKPRWRVVTEYGRNVTAKTAWLVSRVEYAFDNAPLEVDDLRTVILHAGR